MNKNQDQNNKNAQGNAPRSFYYGGEQPSAKSVSEAPENEKRFRKISPKTYTLIAFVIIMTLVCVIVVMVNKGYVIKNVIWEGSSVYSEEELQSVIDEYCYEKGTRSYFYVNADELSEYFLKRMPYIKEISIKKQLPDTLTISMKGEEGIGFFSFGTSFYIINSEMKVLQKTESRPLKDSLMEIEIASLKQINVGEKIVFDENARMDPETFSRIYRAMMSSTVGGRIGYMDAKNQFELSMKFSSGVDVYIGSVKDVEEKFQSLYKWIGENPKEMRADLNIDISVRTRVSLSYD